MVELPEHYRTELNHDSIDMNIDHNLDLISKYPRNSFLKSLVVIQDPENFTTSGKSTIIEIMMVQELIELTQGHILSLTKLGYEIHRKGGWLKYVERERHKNQREDSKNKYDFNIAKWKYYTFWILMLISIIGAVLSFKNHFENQTLKQKASIENTALKNEMRRQKFELKRVESQLQMLQPKETTKRK